jgi:hypothetical protein
VLRDQPPGIRRFSVGRRATGTVTRIESNGLLFGVERDSSYPACEPASVPQQDDITFLVIDVL